ncbi:hypothetical protein BDZ88DRAFT_179501 [Geranomyces variabilis]|nr:hypothetical protein BDZ88DRAFT_179501 [Geranomyces variabilis]
MVRGSDSKSSKHSWIDRTGRVSTIGALQHSRAAAAFRKTALEDKCVPSSSKSESESSAGADAAAIEVAGSTDIGVGAATMAVTAGGASTACAAVFRRFVGFKMSSTVSSSSSVSCSTSTGFRLRPAVAFFAPSAFFNPTILATLPAACLILSPNPSFFTFVCLTLPASGFNCVAAWSACAAFDCFFPAFGVIYRQHCLKRDRLVPKLPSLLHSDSSSLPRFLALVSR